MKWHYAARKKTIEYGKEGEELHFFEDEYELVEAYLDKEGNIDGWTKDAVSPYSNESKQALADWLRKAADDVEKYDLIDESTCK